MLSCFLVKNGNNEKFPFRSVFVGTLCLISGSATAVRPHITYAFAFASDFKNGFYGNSMVTAFTLNVYIFKNKMAKIK